MAMSISLTHASFYFMAIIAVVLSLFSGGSMAQRNHMLSGDILANNQKLSNEDFTLWMQPDCNLVLYTNSSQAVWSSRTYKKGSECELTLKADGILVIYDKDEKLIWQSQTEGEIGHYVLLLQRDHNIVIYSKPIWDSGTGTVLTPFSVIN